MKTEQSIDQADLILVYCMLIGVKLGIKKKELDIAIKEFVKRREI